MGNGFRAKHKHLFKKVGRRTAVSGKKYKKSIDSYIMLLAKEDHQGETLWLKNAKGVLHKRFAKFGIRKQSVVQALENKGRIHLQKFITFS